MKQVLDHGYVDLINVMGTDATVVNAARASYNRRIEVVGSRDRRLLQYLANHDHTSPFRHATMSFEVKAPLGVVARQWWKYVVGGDHTMDAWNEQSRRYVDSEPEFYIPTEWRGQAATNKQGSEGLIDSVDAHALTRKLQCETSAALDDYNNALRLGVAPEQARLFLPAYSMYTTWIWTTSLQSVLHFLDQRLDGHAQYEIQQYAKVVFDLTIEKFPDSTAAWIGRTHEGAQIPAALLTSSTTGD